ncbi:HlyD family efflux transporter periplasmic adaptor subunit [Rhizobium sp. CNPSo 3968]|nr:HlyD family efflux transporter periplasmic adaptor subunit [Rhizobium sp. CNPSo 3968]MDK4723633.1 HlyD family efflux transporter periplasmic adaptor subunit [Rhizobium sp. CNPSo 3968]
MDLRNVLFGRRLANREHEDERLGWIEGVPAMGLDGLGSSSYGPEVALIGNGVAQVGAFVSDGSYLLSVIPATGLWVDANFKEDQLGVIKVGQTVDVVTDIYPGHALQGRVSSIAPATGATFSVIPPENATGNFTKIVQRVPVRVALNDDASWARTLRPGLSTTVTVDTHP